MYKTDEIKAKVVKQIEKEISSKRIIIKEIARADVYGHEAGMPFEEWVKSFLTRNKWQAFYPNEFIVKYFDCLEKSEETILKYLDDVWWSTLLVTKQQIINYLSGKQVNRWQQEGADLILFYGDNLCKDSEKVILINVKSHKISRASRPPNIMSAQRLLEFFHEIIIKKDYKKTLSKLDLWFLGIYWEASETGAIIKEAHIKDLFKLDISKIPQINFDAAIQIQWHVKDMIEKEQTRSEFIMNLAETFINQWKHHSTQKQQKYEKLVSDIRRKLSS
ncbi:MAG: HincII family type II restriction endonuclease [Candidatus Aenigmatarchaeota archaeon]|nr:HincII family type II restriction endonuclease [Candidatus Rehaiarchaeum fermentans]